MKKSKIKDGEVKILLERWDNLIPDLKKKIMEFLVELLKENDNEIDWSENLNGIGECVTISYDGGNHPEYASNVYSTLYGMKLDCGKVFFNIEDDAEYSTEYIPIEELIAVYQFIQKFKEELDIK